jgi:hypothetical protein
MSGGLALLVGLSAIVVLGAVIGLWRTQKGLAILLLVVSASLIGFPLLFTSGPSLLGMGSRTDENETPDEVNFGEAPPDIVDSGAEDIADGVAPSDQQADVVARRPLEEPRNDVELSQPTKNIDDVAQLRQDIEQGNKLSSENNRTLLDQIAQLQEQVNLQRGTMNQMAEAQRSSKDQLDAARRDLQELTQGIERRAPTAPSNVAQTIGRVDPSRTATDFSGYGNGSPGFSNVAPGYATNSDAYANNSPGFAGGYSYRANATRTFAAGYAPPAQAYAGSQMSSYTSATWTAAYAPTTATPAPCAIPVVIQRSPYYGPGGLSTFIRRRGF